MVTQNLVEYLEDANIYEDAMHSDHCGISVTLKQDLIKSGS